MEDEYYTIASPTEGLYKEKGSKFHAYAYRVKDENGVEEALLQVKSLHHKARHHCYAYLIGVDGALYRANDDGEPSGTAGRPILGQIKSQGLKDVLVIVVRYFGGTKLGVSGLITAYKEAARSALETATRTKVVIGRTYRLLFDYPDMGHVMNTIKSLDLSIQEKSFTDRCMIYINVRLSMEYDLIQKLKAKLMQVSLDQIDEETEVPFCQIEKI